jgi:hypothetical protein
LIRRVSSSNEDIKAVIMNTYRSIFWHKLTEEPIATMKRKEHGERKEGGHHSPVKQLEPGVVLHCRSKLYSLTVSASFIMKVNELKNGKHNK